MNKTKMILAGTGGAIGLVVLALAFLVWQAFSAKTAALEGDYDEGTEGLVAVEGRAQTLSRKPVYPCAASVTSIEENQKSVDEWCKEGLALAARGDRVYEKTTAPKFKAFLVADAHRISVLPGGVAGKLVKPEFAFGPFKDYISEGKMPAESDLAVLQRQWDDVATIAEMMSTNGVYELVDIQFKAAAAKEEDRDVRGKNKKNVRGAKQEAKKMANEPDSCSYVFTLAARPPAFIRLLNELEACERFVTVDAFTFARTGDAIAGALGGDEKAAAEQQAGGRRGRRAKKAAPEPDGKKEGETKNGVVTDPQTDAPLTVTLTLTVHDFRSLASNESENDAASPNEKGDLK